MLIGWYPPVVAASFVRSRSSRASDSKGRTLSKASRNGTHETSGLCSLPALDCISSRAVTHGLALPITELRDEHGQAIHLRVRLDWQGRVRNLLPELTPDWWRMGSRGPLRVSEAKWGNLFTYCYPPCLAQPRDMMSSKASRRYNQGSETFGRATVADFRARRLCI
jgi:hypothetical protein